MLRMTLLCSLAPMVLAGCATVGLLQPGVVGPVEIGRIASVGLLRVTPLAVLEDSRCPEDARCIWAGRLKIRAAISGSEGRRTVELVLGKGYLVANGALTLETATPVPRTDAPTKPSNYRFGFTYAAGR